MAVAPFPVDPVRTAITIAYRNTSYIADAVLPRAAVAKQEFTYNAYPIEETFAMPDTKVGRRGRPTEVDLTATEITDATEDHGLDDPIPQGDINNAPEGYNPVDRSVAQLTDYVLLGREKRTADLVFNAAKYAAGYKVQLAGNSQFSDFANSDPVGVVMTGLDACLLRPNVMVLGQSVYSKLVQHPKIVKAVLGNAGDSGIVTRQALANLFEMEEVLVGTGRVNIAAKGQAAVLSRVWGKHISLIYRNKNADTRTGITFGLTAQWGNRIASVELDKNIGLRGGQRVRVGESVKELIIAPLCGYFIQDAVA